MPPAGQLWIPRVGEGQRCVRPRRHRVYVSVYEPGMRSDTPVEPPYLTKAADVFDRALATFERATSLSGFSISFHLAGHVIRLRFAGDALMPLLAPAFAHLQDAGDRPADLTICCWDDASTGVVTEEPARASERNGTDFIDGPVRIAWESEQRNFSAFSVKERLALLRTPDARGLPVWEQAAPMRKILHWWAAERGLQLVHAAAVGSHTGGVLLVGPGGSGKSTTALACVGSSIGYAGDDYCLLSINATSNVHALYCSGKADAASIAMLPRLQTAFTNSTLSAEGKSIIFVTDQYPEAMVRSFPLRAVVVPRITPDVDCRLDAITGAEALRAMAPSTLFQMPGNRAASLSRLATLTRAVPCWRLTLGKDRKAAQSLLAALSFDRKAPS